MASSAAHFTNVSVVGVADVDPPHRVPSAGIEERLRDVFEQHGMPASILRATAGIEARRYWDEGLEPSDVATLAARKVLKQTGVDPGAIGALLSTSVCKDYIEPSVASTVHGNLGLSPACLNFDVGNACLAFLSGMTIVGNMIERGQIDYGLVVDGEDARRPTEATIARMLSGELDGEGVRRNFATLTLGSAAVAMVLARSDLAPGGHRFRGGVTVAGTEHNRLCWGQRDRMETDARALLMAGVGLAKRTFAAAGTALGWTVDSLDELVLHQVSQVHSTSLLRTLGLSPERAYSTFPEFGNVGPAAIPLTLSKARDAGRISRGDRVGLLGIGSGLNCAMMEIEW